MEPKIMITNEEKIVFRKRIGKEGKIQKLHSTSRENRIKAILHIFQEALIKAETTDDYLFCWEISPTEALGEECLDLAWSMKKSHEDELHVWRLLDPEKNVRLSPEANALLDQRTTDEISAGDKINIYGVA